MWLRDVRRVRQCVTPLMMVLGVAAIMLALGASSGASGNSIRTRDLSTSTHSLTVAQAAIAPTFDFEHVRGFEDAQAVYNLYSQLFTWGPGGSNRSGAKMVSPDPTRIRGSLAQRWTVSKDGTTYTIHLRKGVKSPYGHTLTADDVIWSLDRAFGIGGAGKFFASVIDLPSNGYSKVNKYTVRLHLTTRNYLFLPILATHPGTIFDSVEAKKHTTPSDPWAQKWLGNHDAGFGAYHVTSLVPGRSMVMVRNPFYWGPRPYYDRITFEAVPEAANRLALLDRGAVQVAEFLDPRQLSLARRSRSLHVFDVPVSTLYVDLIPNMHQAPLDNLVVRQAIAQALPYAGIIKGIYLGSAAQVKTHIPDAFGATSRYWTYKYNAAKAKALIAKLPKINLTLTYETTRPDIDQLAHVIQTSLGAVGIGITLNGEPTSTYSTTLLNDHFQLALDENYPIIPDGIYTAQTFYSSTSIYNYSGYKNATLDKLITDTKPILRARERLPNLRRMQKYLMRDLPAIMILSPGAHVAVAKHVSSYVYYPDNTIRYYLLKGTS